MKPVTYDSLSLIQPALDHNWNIDFNFQHPFNYIGFFPATSCEFSPFNTASKTFHAGNTPVEIPIGSTTPRSVIITFIDNEKRGLEKWFKAWADLINGYGKGMMVLESAIRHVTIQELDIKKEPVNIYDYWVWPVGDYKIALTSEGKVSIFSQQFCISGEL